MGTKVINYRRIEFPLFSCCRHICSSTQGVFPVIKFGECPSEKFGKEEKFEFLQILILGSKWSLSFCLILELKYFTLLISSFFLWYATTCCNEYDMIWHEIFSSCLNDSEVDFQGLVLHGYQKVVAIIYSLVTMKIVMIIPQLENCWIRRMVA